MSLHYLSKYKQYQLVMKSGRRKEVEGEVIDLPAQRIQFNGGVFTPKIDSDDKEEVEVAKKQVEFLDRQIERGNNKIWKVTDADIKLAKQYAEEVKELDKKYAEKKEAIKRVQRMGSDHLVNRGATSTDKAVGTVKEKVKNPDASEQAKKSSDKTKAKQSEKSPDELNDKDDNVKNNSSEFEEKK